MTVDVLVARCVADRQAAAGISCAWTPGDSGSPVTRGGGPGGFRRRLVSTVDAAGDGKSRLTERAVLWRNSLAGRPVDA